VATGRSSGPVRPGTLVLPAVGLGTFLALMSVMVIALLVGRKLRARVPAHLIQRGAAAVFVVFALLAAWEALL
jgi:putative Ca2+/H+ antiporter (TMEM165/GDT1 family)